MAKTYLDIVNEALLEAKVSLDPLEAADWANPPRTIMYNNFKRWVARAYKELMLRRPEWQFRNERSIVTVWPRLLLSGLTETVAVGDILECVSSGTRFTVLDTHDIEEVESSTEVMLTVSVEYSPDSDGNNVILNERIDRVAPTSDLDIGYIKGRGRYDFTELDPTIDQIDSTTVTIQPAVAYTPNPTGGNLQDAYPVNFIPWDKYDNYFSQFRDNLGRPGYIGQATDGLWDFYPRPDGPYDVSFQYTQKITELTNPTDLPGQIPDKYEDYMMWAAIADYADYDERPKVFARAKKHIDQHLFWLERDKLPEIKLDLYRFDG